MRSFLVLILVVQAALICVAQFEEKIDYSQIKLRKVDAGHESTGAADKQQDTSANENDNKARVASIWGVKLKPVKKDRAAAPAPADQPQFLQKAILSKPAERAQAAAGLIEPVHSAPVEAVEKVEPVAAEVQLEEKPEPVAVAEPARDDSSSNDSDDDDDEDKIQGPVEQEQVEEEEHPIEADTGVSEFGQLIRGAVNDDDDDDDDDDDEDYWPLKAAMRRSGHN